ncbi:microprocessor complex subunit DGCR8-like [Maniola jurtina]|uniref:microprocessor complex subunit DGCR8-like n=1 Tax=Maniola jurtina TaxID=191418 RepID=UPI001E688823|nr:microprocessor complex subunit DGCR8-like [Maniola jurtina]XP_045770627.1 microprocessor complex subunit DGCR8-like [Maniola jurtina]
MNEEIEAVPPPTKKQKFGDENSHSETDFKDDIGADTEVIKDRNDTDYNNVSSEDMQKLREFKVLDEVKSNEEDSNVEDSDSSDDKSEGLPDEEIEKMLEENLPDDFKVGPKPKQKPYITRSKIVLEEKGVNQFEVLPLDWMMVRHHSGMPIYLHKSSRVVTLSKPYFLGKGNIRRHDIPISAIPCLAYRRALEEEEKQKEIDRKVEQQIKNLSKKAADQNIENNLKSNQNKKIFSFIDQQATLNASSSTSKNIQGKCPFSQERKPDTDNIQNGEKNEKINEENLSVEVNDNEIKKLPIADDSIIDSEIANENAENILADSIAPIDESVLNTVSNEGGAKTSEEVTVEGTIKENNKEPDQQEKMCDDSADIEIPLDRRPVILPSGEIMPAPRVESVNKSWETQNLSPEQFNDYCKSLFKFKTVNIMQFSRWADRRKYEKAKKTLQYPTLPEGTKLITIPVQNSGQDNGGKGAKRDWVMNVNGGSYLSVFHEYVCRALQKQPVYEYKQLENASTPYQATVYIGGMQYGVGHGSSKRQAKYAAARASIQILIPEMRQHMDSAADKKADADFTFFDYVGIEDPRIAEFCAATCEPSPHAILRTCLLRNFGASDRHIHTEMKKIACQEIELTMKVGKHSATVVCKNKKMAKQRASQVILQALHPHVRSWGSLLRLYGSKSVKSCKEKKQEEQQITLLQDKARHNEPNYAVLEKLRNEMRKLRERDESVVPIGTLMFTEDLPTHSGSNLNNVDL